MAHPLLRPDVAICALWKRVAEAAHVATIFGVLFTAIFFWSRHSGAWNGGVLDRPWYLAGPLAYLSGSVLGALISLTYQDDMMRRNYGLPYLADMHRLIHGMDEAGIEWLTRRFKQQAFFRNPICAPFRLLFWFVILSTRLLKRNSEFRHMTWWRER
jgi:hypothetical protein